MLMMFGSKLKSMLARKL
jgi:hypothetical protein